MKNSLFLVLFTLKSIFIFSQAPVIQWEKCLGGSQPDRAASIQQTTDGGYIVAGFAQSSDSDVTGHHNPYLYNTDYWIVKLDFAGNIVWEKSLGGSHFDQATSIQQTSDEGFIVAGTTISFDGDVSGNHSGDSYEDYWVVRLNASGNIIWQKCLGGSLIDYAESIQQTDDGFIVAGYSLSIDGDISGHHGPSHIADYWIVKLDTSGNISWEKSLGGDLLDYAYSIQQTTDGGYIVAGKSQSTNGDVTGNHGNFDYWIVRLDMNGTIIWQKSLGGIEMDEATCVQQTVDGDFIVGGWSISNDGDVTGNHSIGHPDAWIVKLDAMGELIWQKMLGGSGEDQAYAINQTTDGGFIVAGASKSSDGDVSGNYGNHDYWVVRLDNVGNLLWQEHLGGSDYDAAFSVQQSDDGGFIVAGSTSSSDNDVTDWNGGEDLGGLFTDYWIVKLAADTLTGVESLPYSFISLYPNPVQNQLTINLGSHTDPGTGGTIRVYSLQGKILALSSAFTNAPVQINTENLPAGFYTLQIINNKSGEIQVRKFVKAE